jgi:hypothetical protein
VRGEVRRPLRIALAVLLLLVAGPAGAQPCPECLQAGAARVTLRVPAGAPLAGYGALARRLLIPDVLGRYPHAFWLEPSTGERDPLAARALVLESAGRRVVWVTADLLAVDGAFVADVQRRLADAGVSPAILIVSASHTHSGPGAYVDSALLGWLALDRVDAVVREALLESVVTAAREADANRRPARVSAVSVAAPDLVKSRLDQALDTGLSVLKVTDVRHQPVAVVWNYAIHGTTLGPRNRRLSGDVMGEASLRLERALGVPALFVNVAVADVSPARHGERATADLGAALAAAAQAAWAQAVPVARPTLRVGARTATLPSPWLPARNCLGGWVPGALTLPLGGVFPREATLTAVAVGDVGWVTFPGELQTALGQGIKRAAGGHLRHALVAGLSNDYLGYFTTAADYARPSYVSCTALYGPHAGACLADAAADLLGAVARGERSPAEPAACDR